LSVGGKKEKQRKTGKAMRAVSGILCLAIGLLAGSGVSAQHLKRRAFLGVQMQNLNDSTAQALRLKSSQGVLVQAIIPNSTAEKLKLQPQDVILRLNGTPLSNVNEAVARARELQTGEEITLTLARNGKERTVKGAVAPMPTEHAPTVDVLYDEAKIESGHVRTILRKPKGKAKLPTVFFVQGFGCASLDLLPETHPQRLLINSLADRGYAVFRMEKPGVGDSKGSRTCADINYQEELAAYKAAYQKLLTYDFVDRDNIFLFGHSLGGNTVPLLADVHPTQGLITYGSVGKPWAEYLIDVLRKQRTLLGDDYLEIEKDMETALPLLHDLLVLKKAPQELPQQNPAYDRLLRERFGFDGKTQLFGRHYMFLQQLADLNIARDYKEVGTHTLAIYGEADVAAVDPSGARRIADVVNAYHPGKGTFQLLPRTDHGFLAFGTMQEALAVPDRDNFLKYGKDKFNVKVIDLIDNWIREKLSRA
jgi:pimeloyl-ACP methyl ester carboxylesterase